MASQMPPATFDETTVDINAARLHVPRQRLGARSLPAGWRSTTRRPSKRRPKVPGPDAVTPDDEDGSGILPPMQEGDTLQLRELKPEQKFTQPPARYSEATLVKALEENGIGRPSTYASIISVIQARDYVNKIERLSNRRTARQPPSSSSREHSPAVWIQGVQASRFEGTAERQHQGTTVIPAGARDDRLGPASRSPIASGSPVRSKIVPRPAGIAVDLAVLAPRERSRRVACTPWIQTARTSVIAKTSDEDEPGAAGSGGSRAARSLRRRRQLDVRVCCGSAGTRPSFVRRPLDPRVRGRARELRAEARALSACSSTRSLARARRAGGSAGARRR